MSPTLISDNDEPSTGGARVRRKESTGCARVR